MVHAVLEAKAVNLATTVVASLMSLSIGWTVHAQPESIEWRQRVSPALGGRLRMLAVDPVEPRFVFAGTAEGTMLISHDGGRIWQERPLEPFVQDQRRNAAPSLRAIRGVRGEDLRQNPVRRIAVCPGQLYRLLVATRSTLYGSQDHGLTFVKLFGVSPREELRVVDCRPQCPGIVALATDQGLFVSRDGGIAFSSGASPVGKAVSTVEVDCQTDEPSILFAQSRRLYRADLTESDVVPLYPSAATGKKLPAPSADIEDIELQGQHIWLGTTRGVQRSTDGGRTWQSFTSDLGRFVRQVVVRPATHDGAHQVAAVLDLAADTGRQSSALNAIAVVTSDDGQTWAPLYAGLSQRRVRWLATMPTSNGLAWWLATSGGVWSQAMPELPPPGRELLRDWARRRLTRTRPLQRTIEAALRRSRLSASMLASLGSGFAARCWLPQVRLDFDLRSGRGQLEGDAAGFPAVRFDQGLSSTRTAWMVFGGWDLGCVTGDRALASNARADLAQLRERFVFTVQDAWHDRMRLLQRLASGESSPLVAWSVWSRIRSMEAVLYGLSGLDDDRAL